MQNLNHCAEPTQQTLVWTLYISDLFKTTNYMLSYGGPKKQGGARTSARGP